MRTALPGTDRRVFTAERGSPVNMRNPEGTVAQVVRAGSALQLTVHTVKRKTVKNYL